LNRNNRLATSSTSRGFAGPNRAILPNDPIPSNIAAQATLPIPSVNITTPADF
jgi:hypothetical protein